MYSYVLVALGRRIKSNWKRLIACLYLLQYDGMRIVYRMLRLQIMGIYIYAYCLHNYFQWGIYIFLYEFLRIRLRFVM